MDKNTQRVEKLRKLVTVSGGPAAFAKKYSRGESDKPFDETYVSQLLNVHISFGENAARNMELRIGLPEGYFDSATQSPNAQPFQTTDDRRNELIKIIMQLPEESLDHAIRLLDVAHELPSRGEKKKTQGE